MKRDVAYAARTEDSWQRAEEAMAQMVECICRLLPCHSWARRTFSRVPWQRELLAVFNLHSLTLAGLRHGYTNASRLQHDICDYLWRLWRTCDGEKNAAHLQFAESWRHYQEATEQALSATLPQKNLWLLPCLAPQQPCPCYILAQVCEQLAQAARQMRELLATATYEKLLPTQPLTDSLAKLGDMAGKMRRRLITFPQHEAVDLAACLYEILHGLETIYDLLPPYLVFDAGERVWEAAERLRQRVYNAYPQLHELEAGITTNRNICYVSPWPGRTARTRCFYRQKIIGASCQRESWYPIYLKDMREQECLRQLAAIYVATGYALLYQEFLARLVAPVGTPVTLAEMWTIEQIGHEAAHELVLQLCHHWQRQGEAGTEILALAPLFHLLGVEVVWSGDIAKYKADLALVEHSYTFAAPAGDNVTRLGCRHGSEIWQRAMCLHRVWPKPACLPVLDRLARHLVLLPPDVQPDLKPLTHLQSPAFWHGAHSEGDFLRTQLWPAVSELVHTLDATIYRDMRAFDKEVRCVYENLLHEFADALAHDGYSLSLPAGDYNGLAEAHALVVQKLAEIDLAKFVAVGYPLPEPGFRRPLALCADDFAQDRLGYCRGFVPEIAYLLREQLHEKSGASGKLPSEFGDFQETAAELLSRIVAEWPGGKETLAQVFLDRLVNPLNEKILASLSASPHLAEQGYAYLQKIHAVMASDGMASFFPRPAIVGSKQKQLASLEHYRLLEQFHRIQPAGHIVAVAYFTFVPPYVVHVSVGPKPVFLDIFHATLETLWQWVRQYPWLVDNLQGAPGSGEFLKYAATVTGQHKVKDGYYPQLSVDKIDLTSLHRDILQPLTGSGASDLLPLAWHGLLRLLELLDTLATLWYPAGGELVERARELALLLNPYAQQAGGIVPVSLEEIAGGSTVLYYMCESSSNLRIRRRRLPGQSEAACVLQGNSGTGGDFYYGDRALLDELRQLFIELWSLLRRLPDALAREEASKAWEHAYYQAQQAGRKEAILGLFEVFYRYGENIEKLLGSYDAFLEWENHFRFLETWLKQKHDITKVVVSRGENMYARDELISHFAFVPKKPGDLTYAKQAVIRVIKPAFVKGNTRIQRGTLEVYQS
jgi:hypothetical protein